MLFLQYMEAFLSYKSLMELFIFKTRAKHCSFPSFLEMVEIVWLKLSRELQPKADIWHGKNFCPNSYSLRELQAELPAL